MVFTVRSTYKLLHDCNLSSVPNDILITTHKFYKLLWILQLPTKIKLLIWRVSLNFIPTMDNLFYKRLTQSKSKTCPKCKVAVETLWYVFCECPVSIETWKILKSKRVVFRKNLHCFEWFA